MKQLVESIINKDCDGAKSIINEAFQYIIERKMIEKKKMIMAEMDVSTFTPEYDSIEDRRATQKPEQSGKGNKEELSGKGDKETPKVTVVPKNNLKEEEQLDEVRVKIVKARIRGGKIQRRKKISTVPGMTLRGGKLTRMSPAERRRRRMGAKRAKVKRKSKMNRILMKRKRSILKRRMLGI